MDTVWDTVRYYKAQGAKSDLQHEKVLSECVNNVLRRAMIEQSEDNLTVIIVCFRNILEA